MGLLDFLFGKPETIWTLDVYIEAICTSVRGGNRNRQDTGEKIRKWGQEILETYGLVGIEHAWRAASLTSDREELFAILRREWSEFPGWRRGL